MRLIRSLDVYVPSESWLTHFCQANNINLKNPITLEAARRKYCNVGYIRNFFISHRELLMNTPPHLIWNADETSSESSRKYKVLITDFIKDPICPDTKYFNRVTTVLCVNALGQKIDPFVIVPSLKNLPFELMGF